MPNARRTQGERRDRRITPAQIDMMRAQRAAQDALGEKTLLSVWTPCCQLYTGKSTGRVAHVWTMASEYRVEIPAPLPPQQNPNAERRT